MTRQYLCCAQLPSVRRVRHGCRGFPYRLDRAYRIERFDRPAPAFIRLDQGCQQVEPIACLSAFRCIPQCLDFPKCCFVILIGLERMNIRSITYTRRIQNRLTVSAVISYSATGSRARHLFRKRHTPAMRHRGSSSLISRSTKRCFYHFVRMTRTTVQPCAYEC